MAKKTNDLISFTTKYSIVPAKLTILYKKGANMEELYREAIIPHPILMQLEKPDTTTLSMVFRNSDSAEIFLFLGKHISYSILVHECVHIVSEIFTHMSATMSSDTEEFFAYLMDYTFEQIVTYCTETLKLKLPLSHSKQ